MVILIYDLINNLNKTNFKMPTELQLFSNSSKTLRFTKFSKKPYQEAIEREGHAGRILPLPPTTPTGKRAFLQLSL